MRPSKRDDDQLREAKIERGVSLHAEGSCLIALGSTHLLCSASLESRVPFWLRGSGKGWVTAEYGMLPRSTSERMRRESVAGKQSGRSMEIQRLIGRSLRAAIDLKALGERQIIVDCDVIQADGGTRTAAITAGWIALRDCIDWMRERKILKSDPLRDHVAAISCGIHRGRVVLDLDYAEDSDCQADANFVMSGKGEIIEAQASAEAEPFSEDQFLEMMRLARKGINELVALQKSSLGESSAPESAPPESETQESTPSESSESESA